MGTLIYDPDMTISVVDRSIPESESDTPALDTSLSALFVGFTSKGKHNTIIECKSPSELMNNFGDDFGSFEKYGQANLAALGFARSGGRSFFCSLLPDDAKRAYSVFGVSVKVKNDIAVYERTDTVYSEDLTTVENFGVGAFKLNKSGEKIQCMVKSSPEEEKPNTPYVITGAEISVKEHTLTSESFDKEGRPVNFDGATIVTQAGDDGNSTTFYPLFTTYYYSNGKGGNDHAFTIARDTGRDKKLTDGRRYIMTFYKLLSSGSYTELYDEPYFFSFNPKAKYSEDSNIIEGLSTVYQNQDESGEELPIQMIVYNENYEKLLTALDTYKGYGETKYDIDFINALYKNGTPYTKIVLADDSTDTENTMITLDNGTDGSIELGATVDIAPDGTKVVDAETVIKTKEELLQKFFNCDIDDSIFDEKITDIDKVYDCNYSMDVKKTILSQFAQYRPDIKLNMDLGETTDYRDAINKAQELAPYIYQPYDFMVSFNGHFGTLNDLQVNSPFRVSGTYELARSEADNFSKVGGAFQMHAGATRGKVNYFRPDWIAKKNKEGMIEKLREINLNYIEALDKHNTLMWGSESSQYHIDNSKLCSDRNTLVIGRAMRICHGILPFYKYDERDITDTLKAAGKACDDALTSSNIPSTIGITTTLYQTKQDRREENAHCDITFVFPDYAKSFTVTIIAKRPTVE